MRRLQLICSITPILIGLTVSMGWLYDSVTITQLSPEWVSMKPMTAAGFILLGIQLALSNTRHFEAFVPASLLLSLSSMMLVEQIQGQALLPTIEDASPYTHIAAAPSLMTPIAFIVAALPAFSRRIKSTCAGLVAGISLVCFGGYLFDVPSLFFYSDISTGMALHTAIGFLLAAISLYLQCIQDASPPTCSHCGRVGWCSLRQE